MKKAAVAHREQLEEFLQRVPLLQTMEAVSGRAGGACEPVMICTQLTIHDIYIIHYIRRDHTHTHTHAHTHTHTYIRIYIYMYMHTQTHFPYTYVYVYIGGQILRTSFGKKISRAREDVLSINLEHLETYILRTFQG